MGNRNRTIELSTVPVRDHCPSGEGRHNAIWLRVYDPIFVVSDRTCGLYEQSRQKLCPSTYLGLHGIRMLCEQAKRDEDGVVAEYANMYRAKHTTPFQMERRCVFQYEMAGGNEICS